MKGLDTGGVKLTREKIILMNNITPTKNDKISYLEYMAGFHQIQGFIQSAPRWFLRQYVLQGRNKNNDGINKMLNIVKFLGLNSDKLISRDISKKKRVNIRKMFSPYLLFMGGEVEGVNLKDNGLMDAKIYRKKLSDGSKRFTRDRIQTMHNLGMASEGLKQFRWLTATHLLCGFLQALPDRRLKRWIDVEAERKAASKENGEQTPYRSFRVFCERKQQELAPRIAMLAKKGKKQEKALRYLYAPGMGFTGDMTFEEAKKKVAAYYQNHRQILYKADLDEKKMVDTGAQNNDSEDEKGKQNDEKNDGEEDVHEALPEQAKEYLRKKNMSAEKARKKVDRAIKKLIQTTGKGYHEKTRSNVTEVLSAFLGHSMKVNARFFEGQSLSKIGEDLKDWWSDVREKGRSGWEKAAEKYRQTWEKNYFHPVEYELMNSKMPQWEEQKNNKEHMKKGFSWIEEHRSKMKNFKMITHQKLLLRRARELQKRYGFESAYQVHELTFKNVPVYKKQDDLPDLYIDLDFIRDGNRYTPLDMSEGRDREVVLFQTRGKRGKSGGLMLITARSYRNKTSLSLSLTIATKDIEGTSNVVDAVEDTGYRYRKENVIPATLSHEKHLQTEHVHLQVRGPADKKNHRPSETNCVRLGATVRSERFVLRSPGGS